MHNMIVMIEKNIVFCENRAIFSRDNRTQQNVFGGQNL